MARVHDLASLEHLLLYICREASTLRRELEAIAGELRAEELRRFERTIDDVQSRSQALLFALPEEATIH
jgi:hypothetical protein